MVSAKLALLEQVRHNYSNEAQAVSAILMLNPNAKTGGNWQSVTKRLSKMQHRLANSPGAALEYIAASSGTGTIAPIEFYRETFNFVDRIDCYASRIVWPFRLCSTQLLLLNYLLRLALINIHAVIGELRANGEDVPLPTMADPDAADESVDGDTSCMRDTV